VTRMGIKSTFLVCTPFSPIIQLVVLPVIAVTKLVALGCKCGGNMPQGASFSKAMLEPRPVRAGKVAASALMTAPSGLS
jgi:hypothetical protein